MSDMSSEGQSEYFTRRGFTDAAKSVWSRVSASISDGIFSCYICGMLLQSVAGFMIWKPSKLTVESIMHTFLACFRTHPSHSAAHSFLCSLLILLRILNSLDESTQDDTTQQEEQHPNGRHDMVAGALLRGMLGHAHAHAHVQEIRGEEGEDAESSSGPGGESGDAGTTVRHIMQVVFAVPGEIARGIVEENEGDGEGGEGEGRRAPRGTRATERTLSLMRHVMLPTFAESRADPAPPYEDEETKCARGASTGSPETSSAAPSASVCCICLDSTDPMDSPVQASITTGRTAAIQTMQDRGQYRGGQEHERDRVKLSLRPAMCHRCPHCSNVTHLDCVLKMVHIQNRTLCAICQQPIA